MKRSTLVGALCIALAGQAKAEDSSWLVQRHFKIVEQLKDKCPCDKEAMRSKSLRQTCQSRLDRARKSQVKTEPLCKKRDNCAEPRAYLDELARLLAGSFPPEPEALIPEEAVPPPEPEVALPLEPMPPLDPPPLDPSELAVVGLNTPEPVPEGSSEPPRVAPPSPAAATASPPSPAAPAALSEGGDSFDQWLGSSEALLSGLWKMREGKLQPLPTPQELLALVERAEKLAAATPDCLEKYGKKGEGKAGYRSGTTACGLLRSWKRILGDHASLNLARRWKSTAAELSVLIKALAERGQINPKENPRIVNLKGQWEEHCALYHPIMSKVSEKWNVSPPADLKSMEKWYQASLAQAKIRRNWPTAKAKYASAQVARALTEMAGKLGVEVLGYGVATPAWNPEPNPKSAEPLRTREGIVEIRLKGEELCRVYSFTARQTYDPQTREGKPAFTAIDLESQPYRLTRCKPADPEVEEN